MTHKYNFWLDDQKAASIIRVLNIFKISLYRTFEHQDSKRESNLDMRLPVMILFN